MDDALGHQRAVRLMEHLGSWELRVVINGEMLLAEAHPAAARRLRSPISGNGGCVATAGARSSPGDRRKSLSLKRPPAHFRRPERPLLNVSLGPAMSEGAQAVERELELRELKQALTALRDRLETARPRTRRPSSVPSPTPRRRAPSCAPRSRRCASNWSSSGPAGTRRSTPRSRTPRTRSSSSKRRSPASATTSNGTPSAPSRR